MKEGIILKRSLSVLALVFLVSLISLCTEVGVELQAKALIHPFVRFELSGLGTSKEVMLSDGSSSPLYPNTLLFQLENGLIDSSWSNVEGNMPNEGLFIPSEILDATIMSNTLVRYEVGFDYLVSSEDQLPLDMAYSFDSLAWATSSDTTTILDNVYGIHHVQHKFRVPYSWEYLSGEYTGTIQFKVYVL